MSHRGFWPGRLAFGLAILLAPAAGAQAPKSAQPAEPPPSGVIGRLTPDTRKEAVACGNLGASCAIEPYRLCPDPESPYAARLITPFSRVATAAMEAANERRPLGRMGPASVNRWGVAIYVVPSENAPSATSVERVEIRRQGRSIVPIRTNLGPITRTLPNGTTLQSSRGLFVFAPEIFDPSQEITIALGGTAGERTCTLDRGRLAALR